MAFQDLLMNSTTQMFESGLPLMSRVLPEDGTAEVYAHYPPGDVVNGPASSRYFYHSHPPEEREADEHGHFHLFLGGHVFANAERGPLIAPPPLKDGAARADVVHIAALSIGYDGLPLRWFGTNRWVTDECLYPASTIIAALSRFDLRGERGDPLINDWLTALLQLARKDIADILKERDAVLKAKDLTGENRSLEVTGVRPIDLTALLS